MSERKVAVVFTAKSIDRILREGGTSSWRLDRNNARQCGFAVCTRNANADWVEGTEAHHSAFLIGKVKDVVASPESEGRYLIQFSQYARVTIPEIWKGDRNPVRYSSFEELEIDPLTLEWEEMPNETEPSNSSTYTMPRNGIAPLTLIDAKKGLALTFGVAPEAIEITIHG